MSDERQYGIAADLRDKEKIRECELRVWLLHRDGHSFMAIREILIDKENADARGHSTRTLWKWYQHVQKEIETEEDRLKEGDPTAVITIEIGGDPEPFEDAIVAFVLGLKRRYQGKSWSRHKARLQPEDEENIELSA